MKLISLTASVFMMAGIAYSAPLDFLMVGDFGWTLNMTNPQLNFDAINAYVGNLTAQGGKIDFIMSMGDNMYVENETYPTQ